MAAGFAYTACAASGGAPVGGAQHQTTGRAESLHSCDPLQAISALATTTAKGWPAFRKILDQWDPKADKALCNILCKVNIVHATGITQPKGAGVDDKVDGECRL
jgi:hypothetical protein